MFCVERDIFRNKNMFNGRFFVSVLKLIIWISGYVVM